MVAAAKPHNFGGTQDVSNSLSNKKLAHQQSASQSHQQQFSENDFVANNTNDGGQQQFYSPSPLTVGGGGGSSVQTAGDGGKVSGRIPIAMVIIINHFCIIKNQMV
jgi:hypothetical protein